MLGGEKCSKGSPIDSEWLDLPRNTFMQNAFFSKKKLEKFWVLRNFSVNLKWLDLPWNTLMKNTFFSKGTWNNFGQWEISPFFQGRSSWLEMNWFAYKQSHEKHYFQKTLKDEKFFPSITKLNETVSNLKNAGHECCSLTRCPLQNSFVYWRSWVF